MKTFLIGLITVALVLAGTWVFMNALQVWWPQTGYWDARRDQTRGSGVAGT
jgi:hypothetical protein